MSIGDIANANLSRWAVANTGATDADIHALTTASQFPLPADYIALLRIVDGGEAETVATEHWDDSYLMLWPAAEVIQCNADYKLSEFAPSFFAFGSNGGGELFVFDTRRNDDAVYLLPAIGMADEGVAILFADSFSRFARAIAAA